jgi:hypothetical protein
MGPIRKLENLSKMFIYLRSGTLNSDNNSVEVRGGNNTRLQVSSQKSERQESIPDISQCRLIKVKVMTYKWAFACDGVAGV